MRYFMLNKKNDKSVKAKNALQELLSNDDFFQFDEYNPDVVFSVGGDGTLLKSIHKYEGTLNKVVFVGINTGKLGFLCNYNQNDFEEIISSLKEGNYNQDKTRMIKIKYNEKEYLALNEVRIESPYKTMVAHVFINDKELELFRGNGLNFSTSLGSSGYNHSLGGPIISPNNDVIIMQEIAGISHNVYRNLNAPLVMCSNEKIKIVGKMSKLIIGYDSFTKELERNDEITFHISLSNRYVSLMNTKNIDYISRIRNAFVKG